MTKSNLVSTLIAGALFFIAHPAPAQLGAARLPQVGRAPAPGGTPVKTKQAVFKVSDLSGKIPFVVTITASATADGRLVDYLTKAIHVVPVNPTSETSARLAQPLLATKIEGPDEIAVNLRAESPQVDATKYGVMFPDGFDVVRAGVVRPNRRLLDGLKADSKFKFRSPRAFALARFPIGRAKTLTGALSCRAANGASAAVTNPLPFLRLKIGPNLTANTDATGRFTVTDGSFGAGTYDLELDYDSNVPNGSASGSGLQVMDEVESPRSETTRVTGSVGGTTVDLGTIVISSTDCEIWRLGALVLGAYHQTNGRSPPAGRLRVKRWSGVNFGTPYTFYDYIVLATNWSQSSQSEWERRETLFHEFGHTVRHVADGDMSHWNWDNFRWAYAREHTGCEIFNTQYAFNEGWGDYWQLINTQAAPPMPPCAGRACAATDPDCVTMPELDWNEDLISQRLRALLLASTPNFMVQVLEAHPGEIHSIREFEVKYCQMAVLPNHHCAANRSPIRPAPQTCPPHYHDDGATCRLENIVAKPSYGRGAGEIPTKCGADRGLDAGLCYPPCRPEFSGVGPVCWERCVDGMRDDGAFCAKPAPYGRGAGYPWKFGDRPFDLTQARQRCEHDHGRCEQNGLIYYPVCRADFHAAGCCICSPDCPAGMTDVGVSCAKQSYGRGAGTVPTGCGGGKENEAGLCYTPCKAGFHGVGPVCWGSCPAGVNDHGATCYEDPSILVKF